ncbi:MAG: PH domain-containing protein [Curvibacter sp.]|nr:PH domain-containing protein [Curvibacter sp.]
MTTGSARARPDPVLRFRSGVDAWLAGLILASLLLVLVVLWRSPLPAALALPILALGCALPLSTLLGTHYTLDEDTLLIRSGPMRWRIAIRDIRAVTPTRSAASSPALSLDRLRIDHGPGRCVLISPADRQGFLDALRERQRRLAAI